jgi:hypothetical protein
VFAGIVVLSKPHSAGTERLWMRRRNMGVIGVNFLIVSGIEFKEGESISDVS